MNPEIFAKIQAQQELAIRKQCICFVPLDGLCWYCHKQIFDVISSNQAINDLITGCPHCHRSFTD